MRIESQLTRLPISDDAYISSSPITAPSIRNRTILFRSLWAIVSLIGIVLCIVIGYIYYTAWTFTHPHIEPLYANPKTAHQLPYSDIEFQSIDGESHMNGWYIPSSSQKTVIFSHGYAGNREEIWVPLYDLAQQLHLNGYNVLMFDYGYVNQELNPARVMTAGVSEAGELLGAVQYAKRLGAEQVYIWGFSMGAGTALQAALEPSVINGMILDSTFLLQPSVLEFVIPVAHPIPLKVFVHMANSFLPLTGGVALDNIPHDEVNTMSYPIPLFMIHGLKDTQAPFTITTRIFEQQIHPLSELWLPPDRGHEMTYRFQPEEYLERALHFLETISQSTLGSIAH